MKWLFTFMLCLSAAGVSAEQETRPFVRGSYERIVASHTGKPFIVSFWSLTCTNCREDLSMFGKLARKYPGFNLVLIATDSPDQNKEIEQTLQRYRLERAESWVFADSYAERLRFEVDKEWYGELPRTYFYDARGHAVALSGTLDHAQTERWIREGGKNG
ncbi:MAG: TlpA family protein disulfide reductase [Nitrosomonadales bacterium]|nr:TlpA family protein disulfide reductase [Nitrosomonadales bacterium]